MLSSTNELKNPRQLAVFDFVLDLKLLTFMYFQNNAKQYIFKYEKNNERSVENPSSYVYILLDRYRGQLMKFNIVLGSYQLVQLLYNYVNSSFVLLKMGALAFSCHFVAISTDYYVLKLSTQIMH